MSPRIALLGLFASLTLTASAQAETYDGKVETEYVRATDTTESQDLVFVRTRYARYRIDDPEMAKTLYRFKRKRVFLEGSHTRGEQRVLTVSRIVKPVRWDGVAGWVGKSRPDTKHFTPTFTREGSRKALKAFGRSYFALKRIAGKRAVVRGWYFADSGEVCVTAIRGEILEDTILTRLLVAVKGHVKRGETVWVHGLSLFRLQVLVENGAGAVGHVLPEQVRIGEPEPAPVKLGRKGLTQAVEEADDPE